MGNDLKKGDRVLVSIPHWGGTPRQWTGIIIGESRDGHGWSIMKDGTKYPRGIHKTFCSPEVADDGIAGQV